MLPRIAPDTSKSMGPKAYRMRNSVEYSPNMSSGNYQNQGQDERENMSYPINFSTED